MTTYGIMAGKADTEFCCFRGRFLLFCTARKSFFPCKIDFGRSLKTLRKGGLRNKKPRVAVIYTSILTYID